MKLITSFNDIGLTCITEAKEDGRKDVFIEGIFIQSEVKNRNNRVYPKKIIERAVEKYVNDHVKTGRAIGELDHPEGPQINLDRVSHRIVDLQWKGNDVIGKAMLLDTPMGKIAKGLIEGGVKLGVSTRGMGSVEQNESYSKVKEDFVLCTVDIVQDPSAPAAFVNGIMEGVEYFYEGSRIVAVEAERVKNHLKKLSSAQILEAQAKLFSDFITEVKNKL